MIKNHIKWFGYFGFVVFVGLLSLYVCFPSDSARRYLEGLAEEMAPRLVLKIDKIRPDLPFGLKADHTSFAYKENPRIFLFKADSFMLMPSLRTLFFGRPTIRFDCQAYGGRIKGFITSKGLNFKGPYTFNVEVFGVRLDQHLVFKEKLKRNFSGTLDGALRYAWTREGFLQGSGKGEFSVSNSRFFFSKPFMDLDSIDFGRIDIQMVLSENNISLDRFDFEGRQLEGNGSGKIYLDSVFEKSNLDLTVSVKPTQAFLMEKGELSGAARFLANQLKEDHFILNVRGTIEQPRVRFI